MLLALRSQPVARVAGTRAALATVLYFLTAAGVVKSYTRSSERDSTMAINRKLWGPRGEVIKKGEKVRENPI